MYSNVMKQSCGQEQYDSDFVKTVYETPPLSAEEVFGGLHPEESAVRVQYTTKDDFKRIAKMLGIMDDFKVVGCVFVSLSLFAICGCLCVTIMRFSFLMTGLLPLYFLMASL